MKGLCIALIGIGVVASTGKDLKDDTGTNGERIARIAGLGNKERMELVEELANERVVIQGNLINQLGGSQSKRTTFAAAFLLGLYRMEQSVDHLSKFIALENEETELSGRIPLWGHYPVAEALIRIGKPAIPAMLRNIETSDTAKVRELSIQVIRYVEGHEIGRIILEKQLAQATDSRTRRQFETALADFDDLVAKTLPLEN